MSAMAPSRAVSDEYNPISSASLLGVLGPPLAEAGGPEVARDRRKRGAALQRESSLEVVARDRLVKRERLEIGPRLVQRIVGAEEIDRPGDCRPRPAGPTRRRSAAPDRPGKAGPRPAPAEAFRTTGAAPPSPARAQPSRRRSSPPGSRRWSPARSGAFGAAWRRPTSRSSAARCAASHPRAPPRWRGEPMDRIGRQLEAGRGPNARAINTPPHRGCSTRRSSRGPAAGTRGRGSRGSGASPGRSRARSPAPMRCERRASSRAGRDRTAVTLGAASQPGCRAASARSARSPGAPCNRPAAPRVGSPSRSRCSEGWPAAGERLLARRGRAHGLRRRERRDYGDPATVGVAHVPQLEPAESRPDRALERVPHDPGGGPFRRPASDSAWAASSSASHAFSRSHQCAIPFGELSGQRSWRTPATPASVASSDGARSRPPRTNRPAAALAPPASPSPSPAPARTGSARRPRVSSLEVQLLGSSTRRSSSRSRAVGGSTHPTSARREWPPHAVLNVCGGHPGVQRGEDELARCGIGREDRLVRDHPDRPGARHAQLVATHTARAVARTRHEVHPLRKRARRELGNDDGALRVDRDLGAPPDPGSRTRGRSYGPITVVLMLP